MARQQHEFQALRLLGGRLCIDFVNTIENRVGVAPEDFLTSYTDLVRWGRYADLLKDEDVARLTELAADDEPGAQASLKLALDLREALHQALLAIAVGQAPDDASLARVLAVYERAIAGSQLRPTDEGFALDWRPAEPQLDQLLWPVAISAFELLTGGDLRRVKVCANPHGCGWLFYDNSKNLSRRWCSMEGCGSQMKMRRYYRSRRARLADFTDEG